MGNHVNAHRLLSELPLYKFNYTKMKLSMCILIEVTMATYNCQIRVLSG